MGWWGAATDVDGGDPPPLTKGKELEEVFQLVKSSDIIKFLDWARTRIDEDSNAWVLITMLAKRDPQFFMKMVCECSGDLLDWYEIDALLKVGTGSDRIKAIKMYREITGKGLKESKYAIDERVRKMP